MRVPLAEVELQDSERPRRVQLRFKPASHARGLCYDAQVADAGGRLHLAIIDGESTMSTALNRLSRGRPDFRDLA